MASQGVQARMSQTGKGEGGVSVAVHPHFYKGISSKAHCFFISLPGPDYFDEEAKCYSKLFEFCLNFARQ